MSSTSQVVHEETRKHLLILLRPLIQVNYILGTCPYIISSEGQIKSPLKLFNYVRFFSIVAFLIFLSLTPFIKFFFSLLNGNFSSNSFSQNLTDTSYLGFTSAQNHVKTREILGLPLTKFVDMACGFYANLVPAVFLCLASCKRKEILEFFENIAKHVDGITGFRDYDYMKKIVTRLYIMHGTFAVIIATMLVLRITGNTTFGPGRMALWLLYPDNEFPSWVMWTSAAFTAYMSIAKTMVMAFIEVCCVSLACCFCKVIGNILEYLDDVMESWSRRFLGK